MGEAVDAMFDEAVDQSPRPILVMLVRPKLTHILSMINALGVFVPFGCDSQRLFERITRFARPVVIW